MRSFCIFNQIPLKFVPNDQHWFKSWCGSEQVTSPYLRHRCPGLITHVCVTRPLWLHHFDVTLSRWSEHGMMAAGMGMPWYRDLRWDSFVYRPYPTSIVYVLCLQTTLHNYVDDIAHCANKRMWPRRVTMHPLCRLHTGITHCTRTV